MIKISGTISFDKIIKLITTLFIISMYSFHSIRLYVEIVFFIVIIIYVLTKRKSLTLYSLWSFLFVGICSMSLLWTESTQGTMYSIRGVFEIAIIGNLLILYLDSIKKIEFMLKSIIIAGIILIIRLSFIVPFYSWGSVRLGNEMYNPNLIGLHLSLSAISLFYFILKDKRIDWKKGIVLLMVVATVFLTGSRKAFFLTVFGCLFTYLYVLKRKSKLIVILPLIFLVSIFAYNYLMTIPEFYSVLGRRIELLFMTIQGTAEPEYSTMLRMQMIQRGLDLWRERPIIGYGIQSYASISGFGMYSHNNYIELLVGIGAVGISIYYSIYLYILLKLKRLKIAHETIGAPFYAVIILLMVTEFGLVSYGLEMFQIYIAIAFSLIRISSTRQNRLRTSIRITKQVTKGSLLNEK